MKEREYYRYEENGVLIALIDRTFSDDISVILQDDQSQPYWQRFWDDLTDKEAVDRCKLMRLHEIKSN